MSEWIISSCILILFVLTIRYLFRNRFSMRVRYALWLVVALRLLVPVSISESPFSVLNLVNTEKAAEKFSAFFGPEEGEVLQANNGGVQILQADGTGFPAQQSEIAADQAQKEDEPEVYSPEEQPMPAGRNTRGIEAGTGIKTEEKRIPEQDAAKKEAEKAGEPGRVRSRGAVLFSVIWLSGVAVSGGILLAVNINYRRRVYRSRKRCGTGMKSALPVYVTSAVSTPCMFGLQHTAIYLPPQAMKEKSRLKYILCHENIHYRHLDHLWVLVRAACVCIHWYNPLVWVAAGLSRQDCELACDEETLEILGEEERINYGRTLLDFSASGDVLFGGFQLSTAMSGRKKQLKERLMLVIEQPKRYVSTLVLTVILVIVVAAATFTGKVSGRELDENTIPEPDKVPTASEPDDRSWESDSISAGSSEAAAISTENVETAGLVSVDLNDGKEYTLKTDGEVLSEEGGYRINRITLNWVHDKEEETLQTILLENVRCLYTEPMTVLQNGDGQTWLPSSEEDPLYAKPLYTIEEHALHAEGRMQTPSNSQISSKVLDGGILVADLNFDGYQDFCLQGGNGSRNIPYYCYLWNPENDEFGPGYMIPNVRVNAEEKLLESATEDGNGIRSVKYYRFDDSDRVHLVRYVEENPASDAVFPTLDLTYVETSYALPAVDEWDYGTVYGGALTERFICWAKQALTELYEWSGTRIDTACFCVTTCGDYTFGQTVEDMHASRTYYSRQYGAGAGFDDCIEGMDLVTERMVWYSPVTQWKMPEDMDNKTDEQLIEWYFAHLYLAEGEEIETIQCDFENEYMVRAKSGRYYALYLNPITRELSNARGPYEEYPRH